MARITALRAPFRGSKRRCIYLDGEEWGSTSARVVRELGLVEDSDVRPEDLAQAISSVESGLARERALRLLAYREHGSSELITKLEADGYSTTAARDVVGALTELGFVDDDRYAGLLARTLTQGRGYGMSRARREMLRRGIPERTVDASLDACCELDDEYSRATALAVRWVRSDTQAHRLAQRLMRRGYSPDISMRAARAAVEAAATPHDTNPG